MRCDCGRRRRPQPKSTKSEAQPGGPEAASGDWRIVKLEHCGEAALDCLIVQALELQGDEGIMLRGQDQSSPRTGVVVLHRQRPRCGFCLLPECAPFTLRLRDDVGVVKQSECR